MNFTLQAHGERTMYPLPPGLGELVNDITREVLRHQPTHLALFIAEYLESLVRIRNALNVGIKFEAGVTQECEHMIQNLLICGSSKEHLIAAAKVIQRFMRALLSRKKLEKALECRRELAALYGENIVVLAESLNVTVDKMLESIRKIQEAFRRYLLNKAAEEGNEANIEWQENQGTSSLALDVEDWLLDAVDKGRLSEFNELGDYEGLVENFDEDNEELAPDVEKEEVAEAAKSIEGDENA